MTPNKHCGKCDRTLPSSMFSKRARSIDGLCAWCKDCHREYMRGYISNRNPHGHAKTQREWRDRNRDRETAHAAVRKAIRDGIMVRPETCSECHKAGDIEGHHKDYTKPLDVEWLCEECHGLRHRDGTRGKRAA